MTDTQAASGERAEPTADEQARAAEAESYGGAPIDEKELADVWTSEPAQSSAVDGDVVSDPAKGADLGSDWSDEGGATPEGTATGEPTD